ncbi:MAG: ABC transporter ATP-binding protein [Lachnospiraceae bacterium]|nr:ABC transporter ATP-binding protein [Lachnospiraceae bacterium]
MLEVRNLSVAFPEECAKQVHITDYAVENISFSMEKGEILAIIGESGSGKSMTALSIAGLLPPDAVFSGEIWFDSEAGEPKNLMALSKEERRRVQGKEISMIFQEPMTSLNPVMKIGKQVEEVLILHTELGKDERRRRVLEALEAAELEDVENLCEKYPHQLSGGMRQRVMIAMAMVLKPQLMIADEPTTALDVKVQGQILALLKKISAEQEMGILFISHNLEVVREFCDRILVMCDGRLVESGTPKQIFEAPREEYTKKLLASIPKGECAVGENEADRKPVLEVSHLNVFYPEKRNQRKQVIFDASFTIYEKEIVGLIGESGGGKSTLSKAILGLNPYIEGLIKHHTEYPQMVFQDPYGSLNPAKKIGWILEEPLRIQGRLNKGARREKVLQLMERVGLEAGHADRRPRELSGGQRQRVSIALALIMESRFIIADEPVSALDVTIQAQILKLLKELKEEFGLSYLFISHDMAVIKEMCDRVLRLEDGRLYEEL